MLIKIMGIKIYIIAQVLQTDWGVGGGVVVHSLRVKISYSMAFKWWCNAYQNLVVE